MATVFPTSLDSLVNPTASDSLATVNHADQHANANDAIEALQAKVGINSSAVTTSLDYLVRNINASTAIVSGSSSGDLVRITQTGAGNALVVEDSANPDSTPFVINSSGSVVIGGTVNTGNALLDIFSDASLGIGVRSAGSSGGRIIAQRANGTIASPTAVASESVLGQFRADGYDGTSFVQAATINLVADGTVSTGVVPGRLIFQTASSAGTLTERMRIDSNGQVGIGAAPAASRNFTVGKSMTGSTSPIGIMNSGQIQSDGTAGPIYYNTFGSTAAAAFTVSNLTYYNANQGTFGVGSTVTSQTGFAVAPNLTGATNNYGFVGSLAAATGAWNLFMNGTADNYLAGRLGVGATLTSGAMMRVTNTTAADIALAVRGAAAQTGNLFEVQNSSGTGLMGVDETGSLGIGTTNQVTLEGRRLLVTGSLTGKTTSVGVLVYPTVQSDVTTAYVVNTNGITAATAFTLGALHHFRADQGTFGAGSAVTDQMGFTVGSSLTGATNNYGFYGNIASGTGRWNLYMAGTAANYLAGSLGIGNTSLTGRRLVVGGNLTGAVASVGLSVLPTIQSDVTTSAYLVNTVGVTTASAFTLDSLHHFRADQQAFGAGSTVNTQYGFIVGATLVGATTNYGFYSNIPVGTGRWNLYMNGTADNYLAGRLGVGATLTSGSMAQITNTTASDVALTVKGAASQSGLLLDIENSAGTTLSAFDSSGRLIVGSSSVVAFGLATPSAQVLGTTASASAVLQGRYSADANSPTLYFAKSRNATVGSHTIVQSGDSLGRINFGGSDGTDFSNSAAIYVEAEGTLAAGVVQSRFVFHNQGSGGALAERMRLDSSGNLLVGMTTLATSSAKTIHIGNGTAPTANPTSGGVLYVESGALKYRGSSGTVTTIANA